MLVDITVLFGSWLITRLLPAWCKLPGFDSDAHYYFYRQLKSAQQSPFTGVNTNIVHAKKISLPLLWHWLVARLPTVIPYRWCNYINAVLELIFCAVTYLLLSAAIEAQTAFLVVLIYLTTPLWFSTLAIGPRIVGFTPRLSCEILLSIFFLLVSVGESLPVYILLPSLMLLAYVVLLSFKFGIQAIVFITLFYSLMSFDWLPALAVVLAGGVAIVTSKGYFAEALHAQVKHLVWYFNMVRRGEGDIARRNAMRGFPVYTPGKLKAFLVGAMNSLFISNSYTIVLLKLPVLLLLAGFYLATWLSSGASLLSENACWVVVAATLVFLLTSTRFFVFLGEAERYLNCIALVLCVELVRYAMSYDLPELLYGVIAYGFLFFLVEYFIYPLLAGQPVVAKESHDDSTVLAWLCDQATSLTLLLYPYHAATGLWRILGQTDHKLVFCFNLDKDFNERFQRRYAATYPFTNLNNIDEMADDFGLNCVVIEKSKLPGNVDFSPRWLPADVPSENYLILVEQGI